MNIYIKKLVFFLKTRFHTHKFLLLLWVFFRECMCKCASQIKLRAQKAQKVQKNAFLFDNTRQEAKFREMPFVSSYEDHENKDRSLSFIF